MAFPSDVQYYTTDSRLSSVAGFTGPVFSELIEFLTRNLGDSTREGRIISGALELLIKSSASNIAVSSVDITINAIDDNAATINIGDEVVNLAKNTAGEWVVGGALTLLASAVGLTGGAYVLGAGFAGSVIWSSINDLFDSSYDNNNYVDMEFYNLDGEHISGIRFPNGIDSDYTHGDVALTFEMVRDFLARKGVDAAATGTLNVYRKDSDTSILDFLNITDGGYVRQIQLVDSDIIKELRQDIEGVSNQKLFKCLRRWCV